jgi:hydroxyacylglutathione hydrolase
MLLKRIYHEPLAQTSYIVGCQSTGEALVIDPNRDVQQYVETAEREGLRITGVTETHIHADFVSGAFELARATGARLYLSGEGTADWQYEFAGEVGATLVRDGDTIPVGRVRLEVMHTPGHTPEHVSFLLTDGANADRPMGIFTGDFVFVGDVGRPDLLERAAGYRDTMEDGARQLFRSLRRFRELPDYLQVWPGHGAGSACGKSLGAVPQTTVGYEKMFGWAFRIEDEDEFVRAVLEGQPEPPAYFAQMKRINRQGPAPRPTAGARRLPPAELARALEAGIPVVDVRPPERYAESHVPGTLNISWGSDFLKWAGWLLPYDRPIALIADDASVLRVVEELQIIGLDSVAGYWSPASVQSAEGVESEALSYERVSAREASGLLGRSGRDMAVLDVRAPDEYAEGHIPDSENIPLYHLQQRLDEVPEDRTVLVYCGSGTRSAIAASILSAQGGRRVVEMYSGFDGWQEQGCPVERATESAVQSPA